MDLYILRSHESEKVFSFFYLGVALKKKKKEKDDKSVIFFFPSY